MGFDRKGSSPPRTAAVCTPRGSHPNEDNYLPGSYTIFDKAEVWAEGVDVLYEDAIKDEFVNGDELDLAG